MKYTKKFVELQRGIALRCANSPVLFVMVKPEYRFLQNEVKNRAFRDDLTVIQEDWKVAQLVVDRKFKV